MDLRPAAVPIDASVGSPIVLTLTVNDENGDPMAWAGATVTGVVDNQAAEQVATWSISTPTAGSLVATLTGPQTTALGEGTYGYRINIARAGSNDVALGDDLRLDRRTVGGTVQVTGEVNVTIDTVEVTVAGGISTEIAQALVDTHASDTTNVHGIADTSVLATATSVAAAVSAHASASDPHADRAFATAAVATHNDDSTSVHGIADTSILATTTDLDATLGLWPAVCPLFAGQADEVRLSRSGTAYTMWQNLGSQTWVRTTLASESGLAGGGNLVRRINGPTSTTHAVDIASPTLYVDDTSGTIAYTGTGWATITNAGAYGGTYQRPTTSGAKATWTTPSNVSRVGVLACLISNQGIAKVTIDGSATAATLLPTAQQLVDAGAPSTILTANGGPFAPTDRVLDFYAASSLFAQQVWLADDLAPGVHTVVIEMTAAKQSAATDSRIAIDGFFYAAPSTTPDTASAVMVPLAKMTHSAPTTEEFAILANNGGSDTWIGGTHGYEVENSLSFTVDGAPAAPADGATVTGTGSVVATRTTTLYHPSVGSGATPVATTALTYTVNRRGLRIAGAITWSQSLNITRAHLGMLTANGSVLRNWTTPLYGAVLTLTANDGTFAGSDRSLVCTLWDSGSSAGPGRAASLVAVSPATVNNWAQADGTTATPRFMGVEDRTSGTGLAHKVYPTRVAPAASATVVNGTTWTIDATHRHQWFRRGANALLA